MADYLTDMVKHERARRKLHGKPETDKRAVMARLPTDPHPATGNTMLADLRALHHAFGTRALWIQCDGETLLGTEPARDGRVVPLPQFLTPSQ